MQHRLSSSAQWVPLALVLLASPLLADEALRLPESLLTEFAELRVEPATFRLDGARATLRPVVTARLAETSATGGGRVYDLTRQARVELSKPGIVRVSEGRVEALADGEVTLRFRVGELAADLKLEVCAANEPAPISFEHELIAILGRQGCNSGPCHGAPPGKGGLRLSLRGGDRLLDARTLKREAFGRRLDLLQPARSLLLEKPSMVVAHGGGLRLPEGSEPWRMVHDWIAEGADTRPGAVEVEAIEVSPASGRVLREPLREQQLAVRARFSDGRVRDVTHLAIFESSELAVAWVDGDGLVRAHGRGNVSILVRYLNRFAACRLTAVEEVPDFEWSEPATANWIDELIHAKLRELRYQPAGGIDDALYYRRLALDLTGLLPERDAVEAFLRSDAPDKRAALAERLLESSEHAGFWALQEGDLLRLSDRKLSVAAARKLHYWVVEAIAHNRPWNEVARALLLARGSNLREPAVNYYRAAVGAQDLAESTAQLFLGVRLQCAQCHDHPFDRWTQANYRGLTRVFEDVGAKRGARDDEWIVFPRRRGARDIWLPLEGDVTTAKDEDPRARFTEWLLGPENPFFARVTVNRIWARLFGNGLVEPVDDFRVSNPPSHPELLDRLAREFIESGYDRRAIIRRLVASAAYQRSSQAAPGSEGDRRYLSRNLPRLLSAEQLLDAIAHLTGVGEKFRGLPRGTRATALPSPDGRGDFLEVFGQPERLTVCACERPKEANLSQALRLFNGPLVDRKLKDRNNRFRRLIREKASEEAIIAELYWAAYARAPRAEELARARAAVSDAEDRALAFEDLCWALLNSKEFLFRS